MIVDPALAPTSGEQGLHTLHLSVAGGLTQFGAYLDTLDPGAWSSRRHWHSAEDEFLYLLSGTATLRDDAGMTDLHPGDAVCWRHGDPNAHHLTNRGAIPARWLIVGSRCKGDICTYPDDGLRQINGETTWQLVADDGTVQKGGSLPPELLNLPAPWGRPWDGTARQPVIRAGSVPGVSDPGSAPPPYDTLGDYIAHPMSDAGGLTQFGAFTETLLPGARSGHRHWHSNEDEFLYTLDGTVTLHEDTGPTDVPPGTCVCWPAGVPNGHCLENRTAQPVTYFVAGSRLAEDEVTYPDIDLHYSRKGGVRILSHKDGTPYPGWPRGVTR
jgi:uncharacterized cupin superfamily protein